MQGSVTERPKVAVLKTVEVKASVGSNPTASAIYTCSMRTTVVTSFDEKYFTYASVMLKTFSENYSGTEQITVHCLVPSSLLGAESRMLDITGNLGNVSIKFITSELYEDFSKNSKTNLVNPWITNNAWHRVFMGSMLLDFDKAIYIDPDTVILRDVSPLFNFKLINKIAAYCDPGKISSGAQSVDTPYFNDGVFITDLNFWREIDIANSVIPYVEQVGVTEHIEQDMLNTFLSDHLAPLPYTFNTPSWFGNTDVMPRVIEDPLIVHFFGPHKPWQNRKAVDPWTPIWREKYSELTGINVLNS